MPRSLVIPRSLVGVSLSLSAVIFGVLTGILVKKLSPDVTLVTTLFYRFLFSLPILIAVALYARGRAATFYPVRGASLTFGHDTGCRGIDSGALCDERLRYGTASAVAVNIPRSRNSDGSDTLFLSGSTL